MSFKRHGEIYPSDGSTDPKTGAPAHRSDEFPVGYSLAGRSPAEPASASPTAGEYAAILWRRSISFLRSAYSLTKNIGSESTLANLFFCPADGVHLRLFVPTVVLGELYTGAHHVDDPAPLLEKIADLLEDVRVLDFDHACAKRFGEVRGSLLRQGISIPTADLMIGTIALVHDLIHRSARQ